MPMGGLTTTGSVANHAACRLRAFRCARGYDAEERWRGGRDSNPRGDCSPSGLANRRTRPTMRPPHIGHSIPTYDYARCGVPRPATGSWRREWDSNPRGLRLVVFKTTALNRSAISPKPAIFTCEIGRRDRNRTCNLRFWRPLLCLIELPAYRPSSYHTGNKFASSI